MTLFTVICVNREVVKTFSHIKAMNDGIVDMSTSENLISCSGR